jgi:hypothetical protein
MPPWLESLFLIMFSPRVAEHIGGFYLLWMTIFIGINIIWDIRSKKTPTFHLSMMPQKTTVVYNAATFCSSILLLLAVFQPAARTLAGDVYVPLALAGFSGLTQSIGAICPYVHDPLLSARSSADSASRT